MVAINQVCAERQLPVEVVLEAVETALVSAYKRNYGAETISAKVDRSSGSVTIFVEKEVVDEVLDENNEISLPDAQAIRPDAQIGELIQIESTPDNFGRIAAQTTKQVILQRIREAEREALYNTYAEREGEIVNGTVHKFDSHQVILSLGKVEAVLPRSEQIPTERYSESQRLRAYVSEVTKTPRGPLITVSRTHRNMLRRLLEVEVPEIYNGTVEIKAIAREAGYRSKVAVAALQEGVDPVGSCVGMRGVRIQSIVNELNGEKIDVAEWSPDTRIFIANALSPAKVLNVVLQDITGSKTALVVVPDRQLSLAIGKEGQNARLAAKLTGWRIDIKSAIEAAREAIAKASASAAIKKRVSNRPEIFSLVASILSEKDSNANMSQGELQLLSEAIELVEQARLQVERERIEAEKAARAKEIAESSAAVDILAQAQALLGGDLLEDEDESTEAETLEAEIQDVEAEADLVEDGEAEIDILAQAEANLDVEATSEAEADLAPAVEAEADVTAEAEVEAETEVATTQVEAEEQTKDSAIDPIVEEFLEGEPSAEPAPSVLETIVEDPPKSKKKKTTKKKLKTLVVDDDDDFDAYGAKRKSRSKGKTLEYNEDLGKVVIKRRRKKSRQQDWDEYYEDLDD